MLYTDDEIHEYKYSFSNNRNMFERDSDNLISDSDEDEMTQDEIDLMTDACNRANLYIEPVLPIEDIISREKVLNTVKYMREACDTDDIDDFYGLLIEAFRVLV